MVSHSEEPSAPEVSERAREKPRAAARMGLSAEGALWHWGIEYLERHRVRAQTAICLGAAMLDLGGSEAARERRRPRAWRGPPGESPDWAAMVLIHYRLVGLRAKVSQPHPMKQPTRLWFVPTRTRQQGHR